MLDMIKFVVISGIPGSGKTTLANKLAVQYNAQICSYDNLPNANTKKGMDGSVKRAWIQEIREVLQSGESVICDHLNLTVADRNELLFYVSDISCEKILCVKSVPLETCLRRNRERQNRLPDFVVEQASQKMEAPTKDEGWDQIYVYY